MKYKQLLLPSLCLALLLSAPAFAGGQKGGGQDTNKDGKISLAESLASAETQFKRMDTNHDGKLTVEEMFAKRGAKNQSNQANAKEMAAKRLAKQDTNKDGVISLDEFKAVAQAQFTRMDKDHNGVLEGDELKMKKRQRSH